MVDETQVLAMFDCLYDAAVRQDRPRVFELPKVARDLCGTQATCLQIRLHEFSVFKNKAWQWLLFARNLLRVFQGALQNEPGYRVDIYSGDVAAQTHCF